MTGSSLLSQSALLFALLAALSHELGSPLAAIKGAAHAGALDAASLRRLVDRRAGRYRRADAR
jgi:signal transduction histidine kinase